MISDTSSSSGSSTEGSSTLTAALRRTAAFLEAVTVFRTVVVLVLRYFLMVTGIRSRGAPGEVARGMRLRKISLGVHPTLSFN